MNPEANAEQEIRDAVEAIQGFDRRSFLRKAAVGAFAAPVIASFTLDGMAYADSGPLGATLGNQCVPNQFLGNQAFLSTEGRATGFGLGNTSGGFLPNFGTVVFAANNGELNGESGGFLVAGGDGFFYSLNLSTTAFFEDGNGGECASLIGDDRNDDEVTLQLHSPADGPSQVVYASNGTTEYACVDLTVGNIAITVENE